MKVIFMGSPEFAVSSLQALVGSSHQVVAAVTRKDEIRGRNKKVAPTAVKAYAEAHDIPVLTPERMRDEGFLQTLAAYRADVAVVASFGKLLPPEVLTMFPCGCVNVHASLLPAYRGASPIQSALRDGRAETGITIMRMGEGLDDGDICLQRALPIAADENFASLHDRLAKLGGELLVEALDKLSAGDLPATAQDDAASCYCQKLCREDEIIDWSAEARAIHDLVRSLSPAPGACTGWQGEPIKLLTTALAAATATGTPGDILGTDKKRGLQVAAKNGTLWVKEVKPAGKKAMPALDWYRGQRGIENPRFCSE